jgi:hypothetical protein
MGTLSVFIKCPPLVKHKGISMTYKAKKKRVYRKNHEKKPWESIDLTYYDLAKSKLKLTIKGFVWAIEARGITKGSLAGQLVDGKRKIKIQHEGERKTIQGNRLAYYMMHGILPDLVIAVDGNYENYSKDNLIGLAKYKSLYVNINWDVLNYKWVPLLTIKGFTAEYLGHYDTEQEAIDIYNDAAKEVGIMETYSIYNPDKPQADRALKPFVAGVF